MTARSDGAELAREIHVRRGIGVAAEVRQGPELGRVRVRVEQPALVFVDRGIKTVTPERGKPVRTLPGQAVLVDGNQTIDFLNEVPHGTHYEARWLVFDAALADDAHYAACVARAARAPAPARLVARVRDGLADAFTRARQALVRDQGLPHAVVRQRVLEVMHWLLEDGLVVRSCPLEAGTAQQVRALIAGHLALDWTTDRVCGELAVSEATLRRRLVAEGTSLKALIVDARMSTALTLLQATGKPVSDIASSVGYDSPSRFAVRFRARFGFAPTAVRGHERA